MTKRIAPPDWKLADYAALICPTGYAAAATLAQAHNLPIYDYAYIALAQREDAELVTADERMFAVAGKAKVKVKARLL